MDRFRISAKFPVELDTLFHDWLSSKEHSAFTGGKAKVENKINGKFTAWDEYISGRTVEIVPGKKTSNLIVSVKRQGCRNLRFCRKLRLAP